MAVAWRAVRCSPVRACRLVGPFHFSGLVLWEAFAHFARDP